MSNIPGLLYALYSATTVATKSAAEFYWNGPRLPTWDLKFQVRRDVMYYFTSNGMPNIPDDSGIEDLDLIEATKLPREKGLMPVVLLPEKGIHKGGGIPVRNIDIDTAMFSGAGVAESGLTALTRTDQAEGMQRMLTYEIIVGRPTVDALSGSHSQDALLAPEPLNPNEKVLLHFHGGGFIIGSAASHRLILAEISGASNARVVSVNYRLAPMNPFPAQLHDALIVFLFLIKKGFKPENIVFVGDSAGASISLSLLHLLTHMRCSSPGGLVLLSPLSDIVSSHPSTTTNLMYDYLDMRPIESPLSYVRLLYRPGEKLTQEMVEEMKDPMLSPVNGNFAGCPPILIQAGSKEILIDDIECIYKKIRAQNPEKPNAVKLEKYEDMVHVFQVFMDRPICFEAINNIGAFVGSLGNS